MFSAASFVINKIIKIKKKALLSFARNGIDSFSFSLSNL